MGNKKDDFIFDADLAVSLLQKLTEATKKAGGTDDDIRRLNLTDIYGVWDKIAKLAIKYGKKFSETYPVVVDYGRSLVDGIKAGRYDIVNKDITDEHFPTEKGEQGTKGQLLVLYHFDRDITQSLTKKMIVKQMEIDNNRPATIRELLAFGQAYPKLQLEFQIIALKSVLTTSDGFKIQYEPCLDRGYSERIFSLYHCNGGWGCDSRFLAVVK